MKIYHTETQEDFDALMVELEEEGCKWLSGDKMTELTYWHLNREKTCVSVRPAGKVRITSKEYHSLFHSDVPIIKYKAKVDKKMKFTKENVEEVIAGWFWKDGNSTLDDLVSELRKLDDKPEKVPVPACFDEWYKEIEVKYPSADGAKKIALWKLCQKGFGYAFERANGENIDYESELGKWLNNNMFLAIDAVLYGYTIEPEQFYYIPLPQLETSDGIQQVLSKSRNGNYYFANRPSEILKQRYTKEELEQVPEIYKTFAKPIEENEKYEL